MGADPKSQAVRDRWMEDAHCPRCPETNVKGRQPMVTIDELGNAYCSNCGAGFKPKL